MAKAKLILTYVSDEAEEKKAFESYVKIQKSGRYNMATDAGAYGPTFIKEADLNAKLIYRSTRTSEDIEDLALNWIFEIISNYSKLKEKYGA